MSVIGRRHSRLSDTCPRLAGHVHVEKLRSWMKLSISSLVFLGSLCPRGVQNITRVFRRLSVHLVTWPVPLLHLNFLIVPMISRTLEFIMASLSPQVAPKSELNPKFFKSCLKLLDFSKRLLKNCSLIQLFLPFITRQMPLMHTLFFFIRIYFIRISRLKFAKF